MDNKEEIPPLHPSLKTPTGKTPNIKNKFQFLIWNLHSNPGACRWPIETKMAKQLLKVIPDLNFWGSLHDYKKFPTLMCALKPQEFILIERRYEHWKLKNLELHHQNRYNIGKEKVGEDKVFKPTTKTLLDFLNKKY